MTLHQGSTTSASREQLGAIITTLENWAPPPNFYKDLMAILRQIKDLLKEEANSRAPIPQKSQKISQNGGKNKASKVAISPSVVQVVKNDYPTNPCTEKNSKNADKAGTVAAGKSKRYVSKIFNKRPREEFAYQAKPRKTTDLLAGAADVIKTKQQATREYNQVINDVRNEKIEPYLGKMKTELVHRNLAQADESVIVLMTTPLLNNGLGCQSITQKYGPATKSNEDDKLKIGDIHVQKNENREIWRVINKERRSDVPKSYLGKYLIDQEQAFVALRSKIVEDKIKKVALIRPGVHEDIDWRYTLTKLSQLFFDVEVTFVFYGLPHKGKNEKRTKAQTPKGSPKQQKKVNELAVPTTPPKRQSNENKNGSTSAQSQPSKSPSKANESTSQPSSPSMLWKTGGSMTITGKLVVGEKYTDGAATSEEYESASSSPYFNSPPSTPLPESPERNAENLNETITPIPQDEKQTQGDQERLEEEEKESEEESEEESDEENRVLTRAMRQKNSLDPNKNKTK